MHCSDLHAYFPELSGDFDVVVSSGDFFPNKHWGPNKNPKLRKEEQEFQTNWLLKNIPFIKKWLNNKPFLWCSGNHDFINPCEILNKNGIQAIDLDNKVVDFLNYTWYGFPFISKIRGDWNWERDLPELKQEVNNFLLKLKDSNKFNNLDILVAHAPIYGKLDQYYGENCGDRFINSKLEYQLQKLPYVYLDGDVHNCYGIDYLGEIFISNAASGEELNLPRMVEIPDH